MNPQISNAPEARRVAVAIVGGGQAGLSMSWHLKQAGIEHVVFERDRCFSEWRNRMALSLLGSATCSVQDFVRTELRTMFAIASDRIGQAMHPSQVAGGYPIHPLEKYRWEQVLISMTGTPKR